MTIEEHIAFEASVKYLIKKWLLLFLSVPVVAYAFFTSINNVFGIDLTGGMMGQQDPVGAGVTVLLFMPFYVGAIVKSIYEFVYSRPAVLSITPDSIIKHSKPKRVIQIVDIKQVKAGNDDGSRTALIIEFDGQETTLVSEDFELGLNGVMEHFSKRRIRIEKTHLQPV